MNEVKQEIVPAVRKPSYEPVTVQVNEIAPVAVLCASGDPQGSTIKTLTGVKL